MRETYPTLDSIPRKDWPSGLVLYAPNPNIEGDPERVLCRHCVTPVLLSEMYDFSSMPPGQRAKIGLDVTLVCTRCFHLDACKGKHLPGEVARAFGMHPDVIAALDDGDHRCVHAEQFKLTDMNKHLKAKPLPKHKDDMT